ncbi:MAG: OstA-like protein, partial [Sphingobacteriales bacterium]
MRRILCHIVLFILLPFIVRTQVVTDTISFQRDSARIVQILRANKLRVIDKDTNKLNILVGNVLIQQGDTFIECDSVIQNQRLNIVEAFGNVHINDADSVHT